MQEFVLMDVELYRWMPGQHGRACFCRKESTVMAKPGARDVDNVSRLIISLPSEEAEKVLKAIKKEKDPDEKRKMIEHALKEKGLKPL